MRTENENEYFIAASNLVIEFGGPSHWWEFVSTGRHHDVRTMSVVNFHDVVFLQFDIM